jgi:hypothetical protein
MEGENNKDCNGAVSVLIFGVLVSRSRRWRVDWTFCYMGGSRALLILDVQETLVPPRKGSGTRSSVIQTSRSRHVVVVVAE